MIATNALALAFAVAGAVAAPIAKRSSGQATYYAAGLGACGWVNSGSDFIVAMNAPEWSGGSHCGQTVTITNNGNGNTQTATVADLCPGCSYGSLDMSTGLFSALNNGNMDAGVFPISWSFGSGSSASDNNQSEKKKQQKQEATSTYTPKAVYTKSATPSYTPTPSSVSYSQPAPTTTAAAAPQPSSASNTDTVVSTPEWWADIGNSCGFTPDAATLPVAISSSDLLSAADLPSACGKWIQIKNNDNGKQLSVQVTNFWYGADGDIALGDAYKRIASSNGDAAQSINSLTWGFIDGQDI